MGRVVSTSMRELPMDRHTVDDNGCWIWTGAIFKRSGYAVLWWEGSTRGAHRVFYEQMIGDVPDGKQLDHLCRVRHCVNPAHLEPVTIRQNVLRGDGHAAQNARKTHCLHGHPLSGDNLSVTSKGWRVCITCRRERKRQLRARAKLAQHG